MSRFEEMNLRIMALMSAFLNNAPDFIASDAVGELMELGISQKEAFSLLLAAACGLDVAGSAEDKELYHAYFPQMISLLDADAYLADPYRRKIAIPDAKQGRWSLCHERYKPYEAFVCDDILVLDDGRRIPRIGAFREAFEYPAALEDNRIWMTVTPNEIETMKEPIARAAGAVVAFGLGLGYFAFMASEKADVASVTVVERSDEVIALFEAFILPQFCHPEKVRIVKTDAYAYAEKQMPFEKPDFAFVDLWHDASDGLPLYRKMKRYESLNPDTEFSYWIEKTMECYV